MIPVIYCVRVGVAKPICVLEGSDAAVYGVTILDHELFVVRWKQADLVEVYDVKDRFHCLRHMSIIHLLPAEQPGPGRLRSLMSWVRVSTPLYQHTPCSIKNAPFENTKGLFLKHG